MHVLPFIYNKFFGLVFKHKNFSFLQRLFLISVILILMRGLWKSTYSEKTYTLMVISILKDYVYWKSW